MIESGAPVLFRVGPATRSHGGNGKGGVLVLEAVLVVGADGEPVPLLGRVDSRGDFLDLSPPDPNNPWDGVGRALTRGTPAVLPAGSVYQVMVGSSVAGDLASRYDSGG